MTSQPAILDFISSNSHHYGNSIPKFLHSPWVRTSRELCSCFCHSFGLYFRGPATKLLANICKDLGDLLVAHATHGRHGNGLRTGTILFTGYIQRTGKTVEYNLNELSLVTGDPLRCNQRRIHFRQPLTPRLMTCQASPFIQFLPD